MANIHTVFDAILENGAGKKVVKIGVADKLEYETARTRLVKLWSVHKETLVKILGEDCDPLLVYSMCGDFDPQGDEQSPAYGVFFLGKPRRKLAKSYSFVVVDNEQSTQSTQSQPQSGVDNSPANEQSFPTPIAAK